VVTAESFSDRPGPL